MDALFQSMWNRVGPPSISGTATNVNLDASNDGLGAIFEANKPDAITHLGFRAGARTGADASLIYIVGLEDIVATTGLPNAAASYLGGGSPASGTFTPPADTTWDGKWQWVALTNPFTPTRGQQMAMTIRHSSGTIDGTNFLSFTREWAILKSANGSPYSSVLTAGTWAKSGTGLCFGYRTAAGRYGFIAQTMWNTAVATTGRRAAMFFTLPSGHGSTFQVAGIVVQASTPAGGTTFIFGLWNAAGTALQSRTYDSDLVQAAGNAGVHELFFSDATLADLVYGTKYYIGFESVSNSSVTIRGFQLAEAADRSAFPNGVNRGYSLWDGAAWVDDDTVMPNAELNLADIVEPASGGPVTGNMRGGYVN